MSFISFKSWLNENVSGNVTVLLPGGFKPMHVGHVNLIKRYATHPDVKEVKVLIGPGIRDGITQKESLMIAEELLSSFDNVNVESVKYPTPILTAYKYMETAEPGVYAMAGSKKDGGSDYKRVLQFVKDFQPDGKYFGSLPEGVSVIELPVDAEPIYYKGRTDENEGQPISASVLRQDVKNDDYNNFRTNYPGYDESTITKIYKTTQMVITETNEGEYEEEINEAVTPTVNKHMTHAEDLVVLGGAEGLKWVINMFKKLYQKLQSNTSSDELSLSTKFDGAPAVFVWSKFPELKSYGLAIKSLFSKDRKIMYTSKDVDKYYNQQPDLANKLKIMLKYIPSLGIPNNQIWQGDFLFDKSTLKEDNEHYSFHPNTIVYKVDKDSELGKKIAKSDIGVVWHTRYMGQSLDEISAKYNTKTTELKDNPKVFMTDPYIASLAGYVTLTAEENEQFNDHIYKIERLAKNLYKDTNYKKVVGNTELIKEFQIFQNSLIKRNIRPQDSGEFMEYFKKYLNDKFEKEIQSKKTPKGQESVKTKQEEVISKLSEVEDTLETIMTLILGITNLKQLFIKKLNNIGRFETFLETNKGKFLTTGQEGFAVSDIDGSVVKLVDRYEFSFANFSPDIKKGWSK
jgi:predicted  nucleic acid-binding Zn-ribbon protein